MPRNSTSQSSRLLGEDRNTRSLAHSRFPTGRLDVDPWEQIFYGEFDGLRRKRELIKIIGD